jgi:large subunit ribosomal protein L13
MATNIERKSHKIDAAGEKLGRIASQIAHLLMGKHKASYVPHHDHGDIVYVDNVSKLALDMKKQEQKKYYHYSGYQGGLKETVQKDLFASNPGEVLRRAVFQMLPDNKLRKARIKRLIIK